MTSETTFTIDGSLAPADAGEIHEKLKSWTASGSGALDLAPMPAPPELPTQPALQLLFAAAAELSRRDEIDTRLTAGAQALCDALLDKGAFAPTRDLEEPNG